jgi:hypothetical protein
MDDLKNELMGLGVLDAEGHPVVGTYPLVQAQAFYNYAGLVDDRSNGIHNPDYIHQLVVNSINAIQ